MSKLKGLKEKRGATLAQLEELRTSVGAERMTAEQRQRFTDITAELDDCDAKIALEERSATAMSKAAPSVDPPNENPAANDDDHKEGRSKKENAEQRSAFMSYIRSGEKRGATLEIQSRANLVPQDMASEIVVAMRSMGGLMAECDIFTTATGAELTLPTCNDTDNSAIIMAEGEEVDLSKLNISSVKMRAHTFRTPAIPISEELLQDSAFNLETFVSDQLRTRLKRGFSKQIVNGAGSNAAEIEGIVMAAHKPSFIAVADDELTYDNFVDLRSALDPDYLFGAKWALNSRTLAAVQKIKDGTGRLIFQESMSTAVPGTILGIPYVLDNNIPDIGAGKTSVLFGDFKKYKVRMVLDMKVKRLNELFAMSNATGFLAFARIDGKLIDAGTHPIVKLVHSGVLTQQGAQIID